MRLALCKGRLLPGVLALLEEAGITFAFTSDRDYRPTCAGADLEAKILKVRAIPQLIALGRFAVGFCGLDLVQEAAYEHVVPILDLGLTPVELVVAVREGQEGILENPPKRPLLVATEYEHTADRWASRHNLAHITIQTWGSTEAYAPEDADVVFDCRETGATLVANGLVVVERLLRSTTYLIADRRALDHPERGAAIEGLRRRLEEVL